MSETREKSDFIKRLEADEANLCLCGSGELRRNERFEKGGRVTTCDVCTPPAKPVSPAAVAVALPPVVERPPAVAVIANREHRKVERNKKKTAAREGGKPEKGAAKKKKSS